LEFRSIEELACVFCAWAEMHIRHGNIDSAIEIMKFACNKPPPSANMKRQKATKGGSLVNNIRAWSLYVDLLESGHGTFEETKLAYERILELRIATP
jgi:pre-mRNA-splicing factor SYF1